MRWLPYAALFFIAAVSGVTSYWLYDQQRLYDVATVLSMTTLAVWFIAGDVHVDEVFARDARSSKRERQTWGEDE